MLISFRSSSEALTVWSCYIINPSNNRYMHEQKYPIQVSGTYTKPEKNIAYPLLIEYVTRCNMSLPGQENQIV